MRVVDCITVVRPALCAARPDASLGSGRLAAVLLLALTACGSATSKVSPGAEDSHPIGTGDGSPSSVTFTEVFRSRADAELVDLAFAHAEPTQLWALGYGSDSVFVGSGVSDDENGTWKEHHDPAALHFMHKPPALAMGDGLFWGTCGDNDNGQNDPRGAGEPNFFMGPSMFTTDLTVFGTNNPRTDLGSHYDMLHNTSFCRGIAWASGNEYWTFNGELGSIEKYEFNTPHEPGGDNHMDGEIYRYVVGQLAGVDGVSSDVFYDPSDRMLYIADTGHRRIVKLDTTSGTLGESLPLRNEVLKAQGVMNDTTVVEVVPPGMLEQPSGLEIHANLIFTTDAATGFFHVFDKSGKELRKLDTGLGPGTLSGFTFGPDDKIWFANRKTGAVIRIDP